MIAAEAIGEGDIAERIAELGERIAHDYQGKRPVLVCVLSGSLIFLADLIRRIPVECETDFLGLTKFGEGGRLRVAMDTATNLASRHVLIVEDIVDTGLTLRLLRQMMEERDCATVQTVSLLDRTTRRIVDVPIEYRGFEVGDEFLVGYGLDWKGEFRNLRSLWAILDFAAFAADPSALLRVAEPARGDRLAP